MVKYITYIAKQPKHAITAYKINEWEMPRAQYGKLIIFMRFDYHSVSDIICPAIAKRFLVLIQLRCSLDFFIGLLIFFHLVSFRFYTQRSITWQSEWWTCVFRSVCDVQLASICFHQTSLIPVVCLCVCLVSQYLIFAILERLKNWRRE